jgi:hypothetical protein
MHHVVSFYARHVQGLQVRNFTVRFPQPDPRQAAIADLTF